ncbi:hypothetical protein GSI_06997 [Ganoderma sinense ZZ0214-1]|uniref:Uncharacterized protein n=1 Tax=Ganoderma sinense ZZ0214-1 TaxID=1077348 RepID=A0A2G8SAP5_9APHY|nr:hypothetical protein GSI_06997 [Ganoderma sinense ZZ0214-1]
MPDLIKKAWRKCGITTGTFSASFFSDEDFAPSLQTSTQGHVPSLFPTLNPLFPENAFVPPSLTSPSTSSPASSGSSSTGPPHPAPSSRSPHSPTLSDDESEPEELPDPRSATGHPNSDGEESDGWEELEELPEAGDREAPGQPLILTPPPSGSLDSEAASPVVNTAAVTRIQALLPGARQAVRTSAPPRFESDSGSEDSTDESDAETEDPERTAECQAALARVRRLEEENRGLLAYARFTEANCKLAHHQINTLHKQLNHKRTRKAAGRSKTIHVNARCITTGEGAQRCAKEEAARTLKSKNKPELEDIAYVLGLPLGANKPEILDAVTRFFESNPEFKTKDKFSGLFTGRKRTLPSDLHDENLPPPSQRPRVVESDPRTSINSTPGPSSFGDHRSLNANPTSAPNTFLFGAFGAMAAPSVSTSLLYYQSASQSDRTA